MSIGALPLYSGNYTPPSGTGSTSQVLTDLAAAAQIGLGIYNETQGGPAIQISGATPGAPVQQPAKIFGFTIGEILLAVALIAGVFLVVHFSTK